MKRIMALILAAVMIFSMTACGEKKLSDENANMNTNETKTNEKTYTLDDLAIRDIESGKLIRIGDSREEVEKIVGEPEEVEEEADGDIVYSYSDNIDVTYNEDEEAVSIMCFKPDKEVRYELASGIGFNSSTEDFIKEYPGAMRSMDVVVHILLIKDKNSKKYRVRGEKIPDTEETESASISAISYDESSISNFSISLY